ncbi:MAG: amidohydrolase [Actinobacteria bacterium]|jgi:predicted TIM-barrel fold metal-dependent hydrolase|nr:amidohydrolase [Actinomycetota bacterium]MCL5444512.1 amidohydrolase [Actinomycetota bacterium]
MTVSSPEGERYILISTDCHAGASINGYKEYLEKKYHEDFDRWRSSYESPWQDLKGDGRPRNWDIERRFEELESDGTVAEVIFPNTVPPFFPTALIAARPPTADEYELRMAGIRAHNRWLADWCGRHPDRLAGVAQIFLNDLDDAIGEVRFAAENGLNGGVLVPAIPPDVTWLEPLYSPHYDPLWRACEEMNVVINHHSGTGTPDYGPYPAASIVWLAETAFFSRRILTHMITGGVFERFPRLRLVLTEQGGSWIPGTLAMLDAFHAQITSGGSFGELGVDPEQLPPLPPSTYFERNCYAAVSFPGPPDARSVPKVGVNHFMWGSDYPHREGTWPYTKESLRRTFSGTDVSDLDRILSGNAASVYGFDLSRLAPIAARVGPLVSEVSTPLEKIPAGVASPAFFRE